MPFNICILTYNESQNIVSCLNSCPEGSKVYVIDSYSDDNTLDLVKNHYLDTTIIQNNWLGFGEQRNLIHKMSLNFSHTLFLDADERLTSDLINELTKAVEDNFDAVYKLFHENFFTGKFLRHQRENRTGQIRFGKNDLMQFQNIGHGQGVISEKVLSIKTRLPHFPMSKGVEDWMIKHVGYAIKEAEGSGKTVYKIPFWPELVFFYDLILGRAFLDGKEGLLYLNLKYNYYRSIRLLYRFKRFKPFY